MGAAERVGGAPAWPRRHWADPLLTCLLGAAAFALYLRTLAPGLLQGDSGELQFAPYLLGVPHPTGYPLYSLLGWAWSHLLPLGSVAYRMNLFSAVWAALAVALLYPAGRALLRQSVPGLSPLVERLAAILASALLATAPTFWSQAVIAEVYSLNLFLFIAVFYLLLTWGEHRPEGYLLLAVFVFGLSLAHHRTTLLLLPGILAYVFLVEPRILRRGWLPAKAMLLALAPLLLYLYIPWRAPHSPYLHLFLSPDQGLLSLYQATLEGFLAYVLGGAYGGSLDVGVDLAARLAMAGRVFLSDLGWPVLAASMVGLATLVVGRRWRILLMTGLAFLALGGFNLFYTIGDIVVLFISPLLIATLWAVVGLAAACRWLARLAVRLRGAGGVLPALLAAAALALPVWLGAGRFDALDQSQATQVEAAWRTILDEPLHERAVLVTDNRDEVMPLWYLQYVGDGARLRPGVLGLFPLLTPAYPTLGHVLDLALSTGRPVYLIKDMPGVEVKVRVQPEGALWRVLGPAVATEPIRRLDARVGDVVRLAGYDLAPSALRPGEELEVRLQWEALEALDADYHTYIHLLAPGGERMAQSDRQPGGVYYPATLWRVGERLLDKHTLTLPAGAPAGTYRLVAGMYRLNADGTFASLGDPVELGEVPVGASAAPAAQNP